MKPKTAIKTPYGLNKELAREMGACDSAVSRALNGHSNTLRALKIRKRAKELLKELTENE